VSFKPESVEQFRITSFEVDPSRSLAFLRYALDDEYQFEERVDFGHPGVTLSPGRERGLERVVRLLHLVAGVSYFKTAAPRRVVVETGELSSAEMLLCHDVYEKGMRDFSYRNGFAVPRDLEICVSDDRQSHNEAHEASQREAPVVEAPEPGIAVPLGGGKDSIVVLEALNASEASEAPASPSGRGGRRCQRPVLVSVNPNPAVKRIAFVAGLDLARMRRTIDPRLFDLNEDGALNGHVPVTAIVSLLTVAGGYLHGYDTTAVALESSANAPTRVLGVSDGAVTDGVEVNHQWSKSAEFEDQLQKVLRESVHESIRFLSPIRRFSELEITAAFATLTPYLSSFRSCNRASKITRQLDGWCLDCPKCRFVFVALALALSRRDLVSVFGADLLDDDTQVEGFCDLLDAQRKPFECVGAVEEVAEAFRRLLADPAWTGASVLERIRPLVQAMPHAETHPIVPPGEVFAEIRRALARAGLSEGA
jgi:hypothetical protein